MLNICFFLLFRAGVEVVFAGLPEIPKESIAKKTQLLFSDDFERREPGAVWHKIVPTFVAENGVLRGSQTRDK